MDTLLSKIDIAARPAAVVAKISSSSWPARCASALCNLVSSRTAHFASNLGVVELCLALHTTFDFSHDRLIWDTGHQIYPHKLITGRYDEFHTIRTKGGLMGYPNPDESDYDLFMTGHAGCSVSTALGPEERRRPAAASTTGTAVAVIGDGAFPSRHRLRGDEQRRRAEEEAAGHPERQQDVDLPARRRRGRVSRPPADDSVLHRAEERSRQRCSNKVPLVGDPVERFLRADQGSGQGRPARRHAVRGAGLPLHRPDRRPQHSAAAQVPEDGQGRRGPGAAARGDREGARLPAGRGRSGDLPHAGAVRACERNGVVASRTSSVAGLHRRRQRGDLRADAAQSARHGA